MPLTGLRMFSPSSKPAATLCTLVAIILASSQHSCLSQAAQSPPASPASAETAVTPAATTIQLDPATTTDADSAAGNFRLLSSSIKTQPAATSTAAQITSFESCLNSISRSPGDNKRSRSTSTSLSMTYQRDLAAYKKLQSGNAQMRGSRLKPLAFAQPRSTADVAAVVKCAEPAGLQFAARSGGHQYEANSLLAGGIVIDMSALQDINVNPKDETVVVGGGTKLGALYAAILPHGYTLPGGTCVGIGVSGSTLGGGIGHATRSSGVLADSVLGATVVLANGTILEASHKSHPELFWAIRGGGPMYGIVTSWKFKMTKAPAKVSVIKYHFQQGCPEAHYADMLGAWDKWKPWELPKEYALVEFQCGFNWSSAQIWYWGPLADAKKEVARSPLFQLPGAIPEIQKEFKFRDFLVKIATNLKNSDEWSLQDVMNSYIGADKKAFAAGSILQFAPLSKPAIAALAEAMGKAQSHAFIQGRAFGGQLKAVGGDYNAFPWRDALTEYQVWSGHGSPKDPLWIATTLNTMHNILGQNAQYYNYFQCNNKDPWTAYFGQHATRLQKVKQTYDPNDRLGGLYCQEDMVYV